MLALEKVDREQLNKLDKETLIELLLSALARIDGGKGSSQSSGNHPTATRPVKQEQQ